MLLVAVLAILAGLHHAMAGFASVGPLLVAGLRFRNGTSTLPHTPLLHSIAQATFAALVLAPLVGAAAGLVISGTNDGYLQMLSRFPARAYWMAGIELIFSMIVYGIWLATWRRWQTKPWRHGLLAAIGATNLLYHFPPLMIVQGSLADMPDLVAAATIDRPAFLTLMRTPEVFFKTVHFAGQGCLVTCAFVACLVSCATDYQNLHRFLRRVAAVAVAAIVVQMLSGIAILVLLPARDASAVTGGQAMPTLGLAVSAVLTLLLLRQWTQILLRPGFGQPVRQVAWTTGAIVLVMCFTTHS